MRRHAYFDGPYPRAYAHRGWHIDDLDGLENTLAGFHRAAKEGFHYLELDVHATADGQVVVYHDLALDRMTDGTGPVAARSAAELATLRVRGREPIPLLEQVLEDLPEMRITIEIKSDAAVPPVLALLERFGRWDRICLGGFTQRWLDRARIVGGERLCTSMAQRDALGLRGRAWLDALPRSVSRRLPVSRLPVPRVGGDVAQLPRRLGRLTVVDPGLIEVAHATGREVHVWTVNDRAEMAELLDMGVDGILTDRPDLLRDLLRERGQWSG